ncbi:MAG: hypothetical protein HEQ35_07820 [Gloeotrichia echinulata IR180]
MQRQFLPKSKYCPKDTHKVLRAGWVIPKSSEKLDRALVNGKKQLAISNVEIEHRQLAVLSVKIFKGKHV